MCRRLMFMVLVSALCLISTARAQHVVWDFENGNDHGFSLWSLKEGTLPDGGCAWTVGQPDQFDGQVPPVVEGCHVVDGVLKYGPCNNPFGAKGDASPYDFTNPRGQSGYLNTYNLNQWGDNLHKAVNDQIATSRIVVLEQGAELTVWAFGNTQASWAGKRVAPEFDPNIAEGYATGSGGIAVLSAEDGSLLASLLIAAEGGAGGGMPKEFKLDLSGLAGQKVVIEVVDAFAGGWGWFAIDEIDIANAMEAAVSWNFENGNTHGFKMRGLKEGQLPDGGNAWTVGEPDQFDGQAPAVVEGCHVVDGLLQYGPCNNPFGGKGDAPPYDFTNPRGQSGYLNTYNLNQWGDNLHTAVNDQIATSRVVVLEKGAELTVWAFGNTQASWAGKRVAPEFDPNIAEGYATGSGGIAVLSAEDGSLLASLLIAAQGGAGGGMPKEFKLDLSAFAGQKVVVEVVDAFAGGWGWFAIDEIYIANALEAAVIWDFENANDHGFTLWSVKPATPAPNDPNIAGDEAVTGVGGPNGLPAAGLAWAIGAPNQFDGLKTAFAEGCHDDTGVLVYGPCNDPFKANVTHSFLNTYNLSQWGDNLHGQTNDQIATSRAVLLLDGAALTVRSQGGGSGSHAPVLDPNAALGYTDGSSGIAVRSAADGSILGTVHTQGKGTLKENVLDLSAFAGQKVFIDVVDAFAGGWGWLAVDEIQITHAIEIPAPPTPPEVNLGTIEALSPLAGAVGVAVPVIFWWAADLDVAGTIEKYVLYVDSNKDLVVKPDLPNQPMLVGGQEIVADPTNMQGMSMWSGPVNSGTTYFWRVDAVVQKPDGSGVLGVLVGPVFQFTGL